MRLWQSVLEGIVIGVVVLAVLWRSALRMNVIAHIVRPWQTASASSMKRLRVLGVAFVVVAGAWFVWVVVQPQAILGNCGSSPHDPGDPRRCVILQAHDCGVTDYGTDAAASQWNAWMASCAVAPHTTTIPACWVGTAPDPSDYTRCIAPAGTDPP